MFILKQLENSKIIANVEKNEDRETEEYTHLSSEFKIIFYDYHEISNSYPVWQFKLWKGNKDVTKQHNFRKKLSQEHLNFILPWQGYQPWSYNGERFCFKVFDYGDFIYSFSTQKIVKIADFYAYATICAPSAPFILFYGELLNRQITSFITNLDGEIIVHIPILKEFKIKELWWTEDSKYIVVVGRTKAGSKTWLYVIDGKSGTLMKKIKFGKNDIFPIDEVRYNFKGKKVQINEINLGPYGPDDMEYLLYNWRKLDIDYPTGIITVKYLHPKDEVIYENQASIAQINADLFEAKFKVIER